VQALLDPGVAAHATGSPVTAVEVLDVPAELFAGVGEKAVALPLLGERLKRGINRSGVRL